MRRSKIKVMLVAFLTAQVLSTRNLYHVIKHWTRKSTRGIQHVRRMLCTEEGENCGEKAWMLHYGNASAHSSLPVRRYLGLTFSNIHRPSLSRLFVFPKFKTMLNWSHFHIIEEFQVNATKDLYALPKIEFQEDFQEWNIWWEGCTLSGEDYFEGNSSYMYNEQ